MRHETQFATIENVVTAICFGVGALLVVLALYTLVAVESVSADSSPRSALTIGSTVPGSNATNIEISANCCGENLSCFSALAPKG
jgi:hypothetical protein